MGGAGERAIFVDEAYLWPFLGCFSVKVASRAASDRYIRALAAHIKVKVGYIGVKAVHIRGKALYIAVKDGRRRAKVGRIEAEDGSKGAGEGWSSVEDDRSGMQGRYISVRVQPTGASVALSPDENLRLRAWKSLAARLRPKV